MVIPYFEGPSFFSYNLLLEGLSSFSDNYEKIVEIFEKIINEKDALNSSVVFLYKFLL